MLMIRVACIFFGLAVTLMLTGCSGLGAGQSREERIADRAEARWGLLIKGEASKAYDYLTPAKRSVMLRENYARTVSSGMWRGAKVTSVQCPEEDLCNVKVEVIYKPPRRYMGDTLMDRTIEESWRKVDGEWWFVER